MNALPPSSEHFPLQRAEYVMIAAFWAFFALLWSANALLATGGRAVPLFPAAPVVLACVTAAIWAVLTPPLFMVAGRLSIDRGHRAARILVLLLVTVVVAFGVDVLMAYLRYDVFFERPVGRRLPPGFVQRLGRLWFINQVIIVAAILAAGFARHNFRRYRARREETMRLQAQLADARLAMLRSQLDPHFLFNTLHAISALVERDPRGVRRMIARLSDLLRSTLEGAGEQEVPLREELRFLDGYLDIMRTRFQGRLAIDMQVEPGLEDALVPHLVLQPLVENAIRHGTAKSDADGRIEIAARRDGAAIVLSVEDNGPGAPATATQIVEGIGLRNTRERLAQLYGAAQHLALEPRHGGGMRAEVRLPFHTRTDLRAVAV
ncbi:MAG TPA: histidine kinase [Steroidobacteraceae bacterium]|nr:histidine kinase [Steroidobacteraceae bacterium]HNS28452.1 histidine kinase [Steroidobacteraceae bacterium]